MIGYEKGLLKLKGQISTRTSIILQIAGFVFFLTVWYILTAGDNPIVRTTILPTPASTFGVFGELIYSDDLFIHMFKSIGLNIAGYIEAIVFAVLFGFLIALYPLFNGLFQRQVDAIRFIPLTAVTSIFILWFGLGVEMKVHFLAFGIFIYLLSVVVQRVNEVEDVYLKTAYTLGASNWQIIKSIIFPHAMSRLIDDIRVLTAISWTYIIVAEMMGNEGGLGALTWRLGQRMGRYDKVFAILIVFIIIGVLQDKMFKALDRHFFPYKYQSTPVRETPHNVWEMIWQSIATTLMWIFVALSLLLVIDEYLGFPFNASLMTEAFGQTAPIMSLLFISIGAYQIYLLLKKHKVIA